MIIEEDVHDELMHYGTPRHSGRYPWGTSGWGGGGNTQDPRSMTFLDFVDHVKRKGLSDKEVATGFGITIAQLRAKRTVAISAKKQADIGMAQRLRDKGTGYVAIGKRMGLPESTVRSYLKPGAADRANILNRTADMLQERVDSEKVPIDIGSGVEAQLGIASTKLTSSVKILEEKGYVVHQVKVPAIGTKFETTNKVLCLPGTTWGEAQKMRFKIKSATSFSTDGGRTYAKIHN